MILFLTTSDTNGEQRCIHSVCHLHTQRSSFLRKSVSVLEGKDNEQVRDHTQNQPRLKNPHAHPLRARIASQRLAETQGDIAQGRCWVCDCLPEIYII